MTPMVSPREIEQFIRTAKRILWAREYRKRLEDNGLCLTPSRFYNQIPTLDELEQGFENNETNPYMLPFLKKERVIETLGQLSQYNSEFDPPVDGDAGYRWNNTAFSYSDAMAYYCFIRMLKPRVVLEIGSGYSTMIAAEAAALNGITKTISIEPYPMAALKDLDVEILENFVQQYNADFFNDTLADGDILFIDSTHTVKASSDCCHLYLRVLPNIRRKITVHVHDIALPRGMSVKNAIEKHIYWTEQQLLAAYMLDNPKVRFLFGSLFAHITAKPELTTFMQGKYRPGGGSFWFELDGHVSSKEP